MVLCVKVTDAKIRKPFLGGWKNIFTGTIYHNAESQTGPLIVNNVENVCSRETQYINIKDNSCQPSINRATQMWRKDCYISSENDKYMTPKPYETHEMREKRLNEKAKIIQKCYRSWRIIKTMSQCATAYKKMSDDCKKFEEERAELLKKRNERSIIRQTFPQTWADLDKIYALIEFQRQSRLNEVRKRFFPAAVIAENYRILENNIDTLEKHQQFIIKKNKSKQLEKFLISNCKPVRWVGYKRKFIEMITLRVQKAREVKSLYDNLNRNDCTSEERLELLIILKRSLNLHNCYFAMDLINLIDQEIMLSTFIVTGTSLNYLRQRISNAFLYFVRYCHDCCFNNDQIIELKEPIESDKLLCRSCMKLLPRKHFAAHVKMKKLSTCLYCFRLSQRNVKKIDYEPYTYLLNEIRAEELERKCFSTLLYVIQEPEIYHLVNNIWHGRSIVSQVDDISRLRLVRFHVGTPWAPWNCILLTEEESKAHFFNNDLEAMYSKVLLQKIKLIHLVAKSYFSALSVKLQSVFRLNLRAAYLARCFACSNYSCTSETPRLHYSEMIFIATLYNNYDEHLLLRTWKNVETGIEYYDASTQAYTKHRESRGRSVLTKNQTTQTSNDSLVVNKYTTTFCEKVTQTSNLPDLKDKLVTPSSATRNWLSSQILRGKAQELFSTRKYSRLEEESARKIQKFFRACRTRTEISSLARFAVLTRTQPPITEKLIRLNEDKRFKIVESQAPKSRSDFEMLKNMLDRWRILESEQMDCMLFGTSKKAAQSMILLKEIELLRSIELAKSRVKQERIEKEKLNILDKLAMSEYWRTRDGKVMEVETQRVARARECRSLYYALTQENVGRIDTLKSIKEYIQNHTCKAARDLEYVLDQELDFTLKNLNPRITNQLKNRVKIEFLRFSSLYCQAASSRHYSEIENYKAYCKRCSRLLPLTYFSEEDKHGLRTCNYCSSLKPSPNPTILYEPYEQMLKDLHKSEAQLGSFNGLAFHIGPRILHHLVNYIWHGKSGISEFDDLFQLRLLRFRLDVEWSPWNSILLTKREAAVHQAMTDPWQLYDASLVQKFILKNLQAKLYFSHLLK
ncbi:uncharacterized protein [Chelonus insularis]|nr:uncharacterized protein LOC118072890 [Chelonus insularis]